MTTTNIAPIIGATMGLLSAVLGFVAEATKVQLADVNDEMERECKYPTNSKSPHKVASLGAMSFYIIGLVMIGNQGEEMRFKERLGYGTFESSYVCKVVKPGIFGAGASFALTSIALQIIYSVATSLHDGTTIIPPSTKRSEVTMY
ncbi:hypothetical protein OSB04_030477 [Centaurea solstitialis]|uniref:Uncharacterized protein n=1 Tax=Centaurea solstitialis TaxID=347529 RepID=A0AA38S8V4_9ASTR|nr:hypothetical protein OSB04_030477 [Centaurea solstitialis]